MEEYSNISVWDLLKIMQKKVKANSMLIHKNVKSVELIKKKYGRSKKRDKIIDSIYKQNYDLTRENTSLLGLHNSLYKFYNNFGSLLKLNEAEVNKIENSSLQNWKDYRKGCMERSISGELKINSQHPFISDIDFLNELMLKCKSLELYERCSEIKQARQLSSS